MKREPRHLGLDDQPQASAHPEIAPRPLNLQSRCNMEKMLHTRARALCREVLRDPPPVPAQLLQDFGHGLHQRLRLLGLQNPAFVGVVDVAAILVAQAVHLGHGVHPFPHRLRDAQQGRGRRKDLDLRLHHHAGLLGRVGEAVAVAAKVGCDLRLGNAVSLHEGRGDCDGPLLVPQMLPQGPLLQAPLHETDLPDVPDHALPWVVHIRRAPR
mmetsp:Transcript_94774/g.263269  ORF Transcript_94774/g.263269 Transcript_94774/m.263269 type:complete len:212 (-) Transcript_94774:179-814(-)